MLAGGQVVVHGAVEAGLPVGLVEPQVKGAGEREQAGGLPDGAGGHVALCGRGRRGGGQPARLPPSPSPRSSQAPSGATHRSSPPGARPGAARSDTT